MSSKTYDVVIIGGGTSGLVLANRLSENPDLQILVLETGQDRTGDQNTLTPGAWPLLTKSEADWTFPTLTQEGLGRQVVVPQGKALGGSSTINSFLFTSSSKATVEGWKSLGNEGWNYAAYEEALKKAYTLHNHSGVTEGEGPLQVSLAEPGSVWEKAWIEGLESEGFPRTSPLSGKLGGPNIAPETIDPKTKQRSYAANTVVLEKPQSGGVAIAKGVQITSKAGVSETIGVRKEVILSAGAISSPRLLELSGIGGAELLQRLGIGVVVDNPHVGENLQNHAFTGLTNLKPWPRLCRTTRPRARGPLSTSNMTAMAQLPLPGLHTEEGRKVIDSLLQQGSDAPSRSPATTTAAFAAAHEEFVRTILTTPLEAAGNYIFGPAYAPFDGPDPNYRAPGKHVAVAVELSHPLSRGSAHISSADPAEAGTNEGVRIDCGYLTHPLDLEVLARQLRFMEGLVCRAQPLARLLKQPVAGRFADLDAARGYVRRTLDGAYHHTGTCAMMPRAMGGVVDSRLRVYGCANLRVCDASIVPLEPTANPQAVVYGVAELADGFIKKDLV
ncbi:dehydrogenase citC [Apiospora kogelbergensis]|uniref:dehydrogenase citC n=1 Tax=Apiospora kogelbergensis TaxID=1337665 RepID=UPI0031323D01